MFYFLGLEKDPYTHIFSGVMGYISTAATASPIPDTPNHNP